MAAPKKIEAEEVLTFPAAPAKTRVWKIHPSLKRVGVKAEPMFFGWYDNSLRDKITIGGSFTVREAAFESFPTIPSLAIAAGRVAVGGAAKAQRAVEAPISAAFQEELRDLRSRLEVLEQVLQKSTPTVIVLRKISEEEARAELLQFYEKNPNSYPSDAAIDLRLDPELVRDLSAKLVRDGRLERA
jgi:hypothetical protein